MSTTKQLTPEYLIGKGVKTHTQDKETFFSVSGINKQFSKSFVKETNILLFEVNGKNLKFCRLSDVEFKDGDDQETSTDEE